MNTFGPGIHGVQLVLLLLLLFVIAFAALARKLKTPYPIILVLGGLLLGFVPGIPRVALNPDIIFLIVLPPLLYAASWSMSLRALSRNLISLAMLAVGLVAFTVFAVAKAGPWLFNGFDWRAGLVLGAAVATTDAIAATAIAKRIGLPGRIVDMLEGESLINDATGLLALEFAIAIVVDGHSPSAVSGILRFVYLVIAGAGSGLVLARIAEWFERRIDDGPIEIAVSILIPYTAYLAAEAIHASGVLAVLAAGLYLSRKSTEFFSPSVRLQAEAVWTSLEFILNGFVFVLIGLQLPLVLAGIRELSLKQALWDGALFSLFLIGLRLAWTFPGAYVSYFVSSRLFRLNQPRPNWRRVFIVGWTGMRGVLALAGAMSLPKTIAGGSPFPHRDLIIFLTFCVICVTLVLQGLTLPPIIRALDLAGTTLPHCEHDEARRLVSEAALAYLAEARESGAADASELYDDLARHYTQRLASLGAAQSAKDNPPGQYFEYLELSRKLLNVERQTVLGLWTDGRITDEVLREMEREMDLNETGLSVAKGQIG